MTPPVFLGLEDLLFLTKRLGVGPVRDIGLLEAATARPQTSVFGRDAYPDLAGKAAALLHSLVRNHGLVDGNKRLGWLAVTVFCSMNGEPIQLDDDVAFALVMECAEGHVEVEETAIRLFPTEAEESPSFPPRPAR